MNKYILLIITFTISQLSFAQRKYDVPNLPHIDKENFFWGISLGVNNTGYHIENSKDQWYQRSNEAGAIIVPPNADNVRSDYSYGFLVSAIGGINFNEYFSLRIEPGAAIHESKVTWEQGPATFDGSYDRSKEDLTRDLQAYYFNLPLVLKINTKRVDNFRPFITAGAGWSLNFTSQESSADDNVSDVFRTTSHNFFWEASVGIDLYLEYFKLSPAIKGVFGINDALVRDQTVANDSGEYWTDPISSMKMRGVYFTLTFE